MDESPSVCERRRLRWFLALFFLAWILRVIFLLPIDLRLRDTVVGFGWGQCWRYLLWVAPVFFWIYRYEDGRPFAFLKLNTFPRGRPLFIAAAVALAYLLITGIEGWATGGEQPAKLLQMAPGMFLLQAFLTAWAPLAEEILFRGFLLPLFQRYHNFWRANLLQALLFTAIHFPGWLYLRGLDTSILSDSVGVFILALLLGWLPRHTQSLWPAILLHTLNNLYRGIASG